MTGPGLPPFEKLLGPAIGRSQERLKMRKFAHLPRISHPAVKTALWTALGIALAIPCLPFVCWGIFEMAWQIADLFFERRSDAHEVVSFTIAMGTIPAVQMSFIAYMFWLARRDGRRQQAHETQIIAAMAERAGATLALSEGHTR